jgi:class 3 adenylate cyclase
MRRLLMAFEQGEHAIVRNLILPSEDTLVIGSDGAEWLYGLEALEVSAAQASATDYSLRIHRIDAHEDGHVGWAAADTTADFADGPTADFRITAVFRLQDGVWKVVQWHASVPSPINETSGRSVPTSLGQLLEELDVDLETALRARFQSSTVTFLFSDIEASARHTEAAGDAIWGDIVQRHFAEVGRVAAAHDGVVVKTLGDGTMVAFDRPLDGVLAASAIQRSVRRSDAPRPFRVRVGVHTGEALGIDGDYFGRTVNTAARMAAAAAGGQVLVSAAVINGINRPDDMRFGDAVALELDGISGAVIAHPLAIE